MSLLLPTTRFADALSWKKLAPITGITSALVSRSGNHAWAPCLCDMQPPTTSESAVGGPGKRGAIEPAGLTGKCHAGKGSGDPPPWAGFPLDSPLTEVLCCSGVKTSLRMDNERRPGREEPGSLTLEVMAHIAKETALRNGGHAPTVIAEGSAGLVAGHLLEMPDAHEAKVRQMFISGYALGQSGKTGRLEQVYFISEGWMSVAEGDLPLEWPPSRDPERREVLIIAQTRLEKGETRLVCLEMVRDGDGRLTDLQPFQPPQMEDAGGRFESPLLDAFVNGYHAATARFN